MTVKTAAQLKAEFQHTDPQNFVENLVDTLTQQSSATVKGIVELATDAEAKAGTGTGLAVTPANLAAVLLNCKTGTFTGKNGAGACTLTGAAVGDRVIGVAGLSAGALGFADASFEATITVADQIQQSAAGNLSANNYLVTLLPAA